MTQLANANANVVVEQLRAWNAKSVIDIIEFRGEVTMVIPRELLRAVAQQCKENPSLSSIF